MSTPPILPPTKTRRVAVALNLALPGAGQWYLGQRMLGAVLLIVFLLTLILGIRFLLGGTGFYFRVASEGRIFEPGVLEQIAGQFRLPWLLTAVAIGILDQILAVALLYFPRAKNSPPPIDRQNL